MAQYGRNFYGSAYYGDTNAFSGTYETKALFTDEPLNSTFNVNINSIIPDAVYGPISSEISQVSGTWVYDEAFGYIETNSPSAELKFRGTCDRVIIKYEQRSTSPANVNVEVTTKEPGKTAVVTTYKFSAQSATVDTNAKFVIDNLAYGMQEVRIFLDSTHPSTEYFRFKGIDARVAHFTVETRGYDSVNGWTAWTKLAITRTARTDVAYGYLIQGTSPNYAGDNEIQVKVWLASSDDAKSPVLEDLETIAGDSNNRTSDGTWEAIFDMSAVASGTYVTSGLSDADATVNTGAVPVLSNGKGWTAANTITFDIVTGPALGTVSGSTAGITFTSAKDATVTTLYHVSGSDGSSFDLDITGAAVGDNWKFTVSSLTFSQTTEVDWVATVPGATTLTIRTSTSTTNTDWSSRLFSVPYRQGVNRLRLKAGFEEGYMDVPYVKPSSTYTRTLYWDKWEDQSFLPPDETSTWVKYIFMDTSKDEVNPLHLINNPMKVEADRRNLRTTRLKDGRDFFLRVRLRRRFDKETPVVDWINLVSWMEYKQDTHVKDFNASPVDNHNTGEKLLVSLNKYTYNPPPEVTSPEYRLIDETGRPQDVSVFLGSEKTSLSRTHITNNINDTVEVKVETKELGELHGIPKHYQYGGGSVKFPDTDEVEMASTFTPSLDKTIKYRYYLMSGWPTIYHTVTEGDTLASIAVDYNVTQQELESLNPQPVYDNSGNLVAGQKIEIPNHTNNLDVTLKWKLGSNAGAMLTDKSSHNAKLEGGTDLSSDSVIASVLNESIYGMVEWTSGEKIYDGIVNPNDIRNLYRRTHATPSSGDSAKLSYVVASGDTYASIAKKFGVYELDLRIENDAREGEEPVAGETIIVPSRIVLPQIDSRAHIGDNPYELTIVYNSVRKKDGTRLSESVIVPQPLQIEYFESETRREEVIRGSVVNGRDVLSKPRVTSVSEVVEITNGSVSKTYNETILNADGTVSVQGDFRLQGNYISWEDPDNGTTITEPAGGTKYYVTYKHMAPKNVTVSIDTTYQEEGGVDRIWRSTEVKEFTGMCYYDEAKGKAIDFVQELPLFSTWIGSDDPYVEDFEYIIEDNDLWVKTWVEEKNNKHYVVGSLQDRIPKSNWFPTIQTGYYYIGKDEFYLFNEPIIIEPADREVPIAKNIVYGPGKYASAAYSQHGSVNAMRNSGFDVYSGGTTVYKLTFPDTTAPNDVTNLSSINTTSTSTEIYWNSSSSDDVVGYEIYQNSVLVTTITGTNYKVTGLADSTQYTFTVKAKDGAGNVSTGVSITVTTLDTTAPNEVTNLTASGTTATSTNLSWTASTSTDIASYEVYNGTTFLASVTTTGYGVTGLTASTSYTFTVKSKDTSGNVSTGVSVSVTTTA